MTNAKHHQGWHWFDRVQAESEPPDETLIDVKTARAFARCFSGGETETVLGYLRSITRDRVLGPQASEAMLRHLEGQRALVQHIEALIERGRG